MFWFDVVASYLAPLRQIVRASIIMLILSFIFIVESSGKHEPASGGVEG